MGILVLCGNFFLDLKRVNFIGSPVKDFAISECDPQFLYKYQAEVPVTPLHPNSQITGIVVQPGSHSANPERLYGHMGVIRART
jgi:hypothetical protein